MRRWVHLQSNSILYLLESKHPCLHEISHGNAYNWRYYMVIAPFKVKKSRMCLLSRCLLSVSSSIGGAPISSFYVDFPPIPVGQHPTKCCLPNTKRRRSLLAQCQVLNLLGALSSPWKVLVNASYHAPLFVHRRTFNTTWRCHTERMSLGLWEMRKS